MYGKNYDLKKRDRNNFLRAIAPIYNSKINGKQNSGTNGLRAKDADFVKDFRIVLDDYIDVLYVAGSLKHNP